jgi:hypothetical protein
MAEGKSENITVPLYGQCRSGIGSELGGPDKQDPPKEPYFAGPARNADA